METEDPSEVIVIKRGRLQWWGMGANRTNRVMFMPMRSWKDNENRSVRHLSSGVYNVSNSTNRFFFFFGTVTETISASFQNYVLSGKSRMQETQLGSWAFWTELWFNRGLWCCPTKGSLLGKSQI